MPLTYWRSEKCSLHSSSCVAANKKILHPHCCRALVQLLLNRISFWPGIRNYLNKRIPGDPPLVILFYASLPASRVQGRRKEWGLPFSSPAMGFGPAKLLQGVLGYSRHQQPALPNLILLPEAAKARI